MNTPGSTMDQDLARTATRTAQSVREQLTPLIGAAKDRVTAMGQQVRTRATEAATATDEFVRARPWQIAGLAAALGLVIGLYVASTRRN